MNKITVIIHSFVDLITNSSSEIFISATDKTLKAVKDIINNLTDGKCDELFDVALVYDKGQSVYTEDDEEITIDEPLDIRSKEGKAFHKKYMEHSYEEREPSVAVIVVPKLDDEQHNKAAKKLMELIGTYTIYVQYN